MNLKAEKIRQYIEYQQLRIASADDIIIKRGLQDLSEILRGGGANYLTITLKSQLELQLLGLLSKKSKNPKLTMWALNAIAFVGTETSCAQAITDCVQQFEENAEVVASGIAALQKICRHNKSISQISKNTSEQVLLLASLRHLPAHHVDVSSSKIKIDDSSPDLLRLALILVGTNKAPENLFDPNHDNSKIVKALGAHEDSIVRQYSCWAAVEHPNLGYDDLGIPFAQIQEQPANVRAWMYEVLCDSGPMSGQTIEFIEEGSRDVEQRAQTGLSHGIRQFYLDGVENIVLDWHAATGNSEVRQNLEYHMASNAEHVSEYADVARYVFSQARPGSEERANLLSAATGSTLYPQLKAIEAKGDPAFLGFFELYEKGVTQTVNNNTFNISGGQVGAISGVGDAVNTGDLTINSLDDFQAALSQIIGSISNSSLSTEEKRSLRANIEHAQKTPNKSTFDALKALITSINEKVVNGVSAGEAWAKALVAISNCGHLFG